MEKFCVRIAELNIEIRSTYPYSKEHCRDYLIDAAEPDIIAETTAEQIKSEMAEVDGCSLPYAESISLYRSIAEQIPSFDRVVCHGAAIEYGGNGYFFTAPSGTGKTTHISLWKRYLGQSVQIINGDKPILHVRDDGAEVCATPWAGKEGWQRNCIVPLAAICLLRRGTENHIERVDAVSCLEELLCQIYLPHNAKALGNTLEAADMLLRRVPVYVLCCDISEQAVRTSFEALTGENYGAKAKGEQHED